MTAVCGVLDTTIKGLHGLLLCVRAVQVLFPARCEGLVPPADAFEKSTLPVSPSNLHGEAHFVGARVELLDMAMLEFALS